MAKMAVAPVKIAAFGCPLISLRMSSAVQTACDLTLLIIADPIPLGAVSGSPLATAGWLSVRCANRFGAASLSICRRRSSTRMRCCSSVAIHRMASVPNPNRSAAFCSHVCVSPDAYILTRRASSAMPCARTPAPSFAVRAARKPTKLAMLPPLTRRPPAAVG